MEKTMKTITTRALFLLALAAPALSISHLAAAEEAVTPAAQAAADAELAGKVKAALDSDEELRKLNLKVSIHKSNEAVIEGTMTDDQQMFKAGVLAEKVPGVKYVINNMQMAK